MLFYPFDLCIPVEPGGTRWHHRGPTSRLHAALFRPAHLLCGEMAGQTYLLDVLVPLNGGVWPIDSLDKFVRLFLRAYPPGIFNAPLHGLKNIFVKNASGGLRMRFEIIFSHGFPIKMSGFNVCDRDGFKALVQVAEHLWSMERVHAPPGAHPSTLPHSSSLWSGAPPPPLVEQSSSADPTCDLPPLAPTATSTNQPEVDVLPAVPTPHCTSAAAPLLETVHALRLELLALKANVASLETKIDSLLSQTVPAVFSLPSSSLNSPL